MKQVTIYCDGSSLGNGQKNPRGAAVALLGYRGLWRAVGEYLGAATNQQAEITAAALGLENLKEPCRVHLLTDSNYVVQTMTGRFKRKTNHDWWSRLDAAARRHTVNWEWVKGHNGHAVQEVADNTARQIALLGRADAELLDEAASRVTGQE
jgi:ribonuclease HI